MLELVAKGAPLQEVLDTLTRAIERIRAESKLTDAIRSLDLAETAARFGIWEADFEQNTVTISSGLAALLERPAARCELSRAAFEAMVHPDERGAMWPGESSRRAGGNLQAEFRLILPSGAVRWMRSQWMFVPGSSPAARATGAMIDITREREMLLEMMRRAHHDPADAGRSAAAASDAIATPLDVSGKSLRVATSLGISIYGRDGGNPDSLLRSADESMYGMKLLHRRERAGREHAGPWEDTADPASRCA